MQKMIISVERRIKLIEKMARGAQRGFWSGSRPHEKRMMTIAGRMLNALESTDDGQQIIQNHEHLELPLD